MPKLQSPNVSTFEIDVRLSLNRLLSAGQGVLLAVSGGRDSMALMHAVARLRDDLMLPQLVVAHLNHGLRGEAGRQDAELVRTACATLNVPIVISECASLSRRRVEALKKRLGLHATNSSGQQLRCMESR